MNVPFGFERALSATTGKALNQPKGDMSMQRSKSDVIWATPCLMGSFLLYLSGKLPKRKQDQIERHLGECESCKRAMELFKIVRDIERSDPV